MSENKDPVLSEQEIQEIEKRANAATQGPWTVQRTPYYDGMNLFARRIIGPRHEYNAAGDTEGGKQSDADNTFMAEARTDIPRLIATIRDLQQKCEAKDVAIKQLAESRRRLAEQAVMDHSDAYPEI